MKEIKYDHINDYISRSVDDEETRLLISDFAILWNEYEHNLFNDEHHIKDINKMMNSKLNLTGGSIINKMNNYYENLKEYIVHRCGFDYDSIVSTFNVYIKKQLEKDGVVQKYSNGKIIFQGEIYEDDFRKLIQSNDVYDKLRFMLIIVARVRNNMFHGLKGIYDLKYQKDLFKTCNEILKFVLDLSEKR